MAYIKKGGRGGARKNAGPKKKNLSLVTVKSQAELVNELSEALVSSRQRDAVEIMSSLGCDAKELSELYNSGFLPQSFFGLERQRASTFAALEQFKTFKLELAKTSKEKNAALEQIETGILRISNQQ